MELETLKFTPTLSDWYSVLPETLAVLASVILVLTGAILPNARKLAAWFAVVLFAFLTGFSLWFFRFGECGDLTFSNMLSLPNFTWYFFLCGLLSSVMGARYFAKPESSNAGEFYGILFVAAASLSIFTRSQHLMLTFVALESSAICFYALIAWNRHSAASLEASVRYLILSGVSGAFFLLGIAFAYGAALQTGVDFLNYENFAAGAQVPMFAAGFVMCIAAVLFKLSAFPFQFWSPDVYQGAPTPASAFLAVASKGAAVLVAVFMLLPFLYNGETRIVYFDKVMLAFSVIAAAGIIIGNFGGLNEKITKRLIGFSGISNAGYLMVLIVSAMTILSDQQNAVFVDVSIKLYLISYLFAVYGIMFVQNFYKSADDELLKTSDFNGLWKRMPLSASSLAVGLASLAGIPPTTGFFAKLFVLFLAFAARQYWLMGILILGSIVSIYYYFKWVRAAFTDVDSKDFKFEREEASGAMVLAITMASLLVGIFFMSLLAVS